MLQIETKRSWLDVPVTRLLALDWEKAILIVLILLAVVTRFWDLSTRSYNHDESIHTKWSWDLYSGKGYIHDPTYHGPLLYHLTAAAFFLLTDNDVTGRVPNALMGIVLVSLPFFMRKWLGRRGWVVTSLMLLISPAVTYYSRFNRHDIYVEVFVLLLLLVIFKYFQDHARALADPAGPARPPARWLYAGAAILALSYTAMETTFIFLALFAYFLTAVFTSDWLRIRRPDMKPQARVLISLFGLVFFAVYLVYLTYEKLTAYTSPRHEMDETWRLSPAFDLSVVFGTLSLPMIMTPVVIYLTKGNPLDYSTTHGLITSGTLLVVSLLLSVLFGLAWDIRKWIVCALLFYPIMLFFFTTVFTNPAGIGSGLVGSLGYWLSQQSVQRGSQPPYYYLLVLLPEYEYLPYIFGVGGLVYIISKRGQWRWAYFLIALGLVLIAVATVWFTPELLTLLTQIPIYFKGKDTLQAGNTMSLLLLVLAPVYFYLVYDPDNPRSRFPAVLGIWAIGVIGLFSWAGEKMPWLTIHLAIPLAFLSGYFMDRVLDVDWRAVARRGAPLLALMILLGLTTLAFQIFFGPAPLNTGNQPIDQLVRRSSLVLSAIVVAICGGAIYYLGSRLGLRDGLRVALVTLFIFLGLFTIHTTALAAYVNSDVAVETLIYAQGSPDEPVTMREIETLSRRLCSQNQADVKPKINCDDGTIKVAYDDQSSWPFVWYFRNYQNQQYYGKSPAGPFDAEVVIVGPENEAAVKPFLGNRYYRRNMRLIWWPDEYYKDLTWTRLFGGTDASGQPVKGLLIGDNLKSLIRDIWFYHKYPHSLSAWPYVHNYAMYVRKDIAGMLWQYSGVTPAPGPVEEDPYTKKYIAGAQAETVIGSAGAGNGQFNQPHNLALDSSGNIYVADSGNNLIQKLGPDGKFIAQWGGKGSDPGQFEEPWGIAVDKQGNVYVADTWNHRIQKFDANGKFLLQWGRFGDGTRDALGPDQFYGPRAIAVDPDGNLWVTDTGNKRVLKFDPEGKSLGTFGGAGGEAGQFLEPVGIAIDSASNIYVADTWNQRIQKFDKNFNALKQWPIEAWDTQTVVNKPYLAVDSAGNLYASDPEGYRIVKFNSNGDLVAVWGMRGSDQGSMELPTGIATGPDGKLYVADSGNNRILIYGKVGP